MENIAVIFGGRSVEHEVSVITGMQVVENMDRTKFNPIPILITKEGKFLSGEGLKDFGNIKHKRFENTQEVFFKPIYKDFNLYTQVEEKGGLFSKKTESTQIYKKIDGVFLALHGTFGEDGCIQGLLELMGIPYIGCGVSAAAVGMDKVLMKKVFSSFNIPMTDYFYFYREGYKEEQIIEKAEKIGYPLFVKPANLGSSVGISKAKDRASFIKAIEVAKNYDRKILVEKAVESPREINCAVLGYENDLVTSLCEEPLGWKDFLSYQDKYMGSGKTKSGGGMKNQEKNLPAKISQEMKEEIENLAKKAFCAIDGNGVARVDFLVDKDKVYVNEINTLPGSISFYLFEPMGIKMTDLITKLIEFGKKRNGQRNKNIYSYDSDLFNKTTYGAKL